MTKTTSLFSFLRISEPGVALFFFFGIWVMRGPCSSFWPYNGPDYGRTRIEMLNFWCDLMHVTAQSKIEGQNIGAVTSTNHSPWTLSGRSILDVGNGLERRRTQPPSIS